MSKYNFRKTLETFHQPKRREDSRKPTAGETEIQNGWKIRIAPDASAFLRKTAQDLADYLLVSMNVSVRVAEEEDSGADTNLIALRMDPAVSDVPRSFFLKCEPGKIEIRGADERGTAQGSFYLEDLMNLREAPFLEHTQGLRKEPLFTPRMIHSGLGMDHYTPDYLWNAAHHGFDSILIFVRGHEENAAGYAEFSHEIEQAAEAGLDVYFYSYMINEFHPSDKGARKFYEHSYGELFRRFPNAKGIIFVGESCQFPSRDEHTTMTIHRAASHGIPPAKPSPGWWPCRDFPEFFTLISDVIRKEKPDADLVLWTYNWGSAPEKERLELIRGIPSDITLEVTFEMYDNIRTGGTVERVLDYSIASPGPGQYFSSEAKAAKERGLKLYAMSNTAGRTWDNGVAPYIPAPYQWSKRFDGILRSRRDWGLSGLMESHHYGWTPSIISECAKWCFWSGSPEFSVILERIAARDFSQETAPLVLEAWREWSEATAEFVTPIEDQYGPCRVGPSYPFIFSPDMLRTMYGKNMKFPSYPNAMFGGNIVSPWYRPVEDANGLEIGIRRIRKEITFLPSVIGRWDKGITLLEETLAQIPERKREKAEKMIALGRFIRNTLRTTFHIKQWWLLNQKLLLEEEKEQSFRLLDAMEELLKNEIDNVKDTMKVICIDPQLGYEPSMDYMTDQWHLEWKLRQVDVALNYDIPNYRKAWNNEP